jgi:FG-GAP-like repeat/Putative metal-binding motif/FG-GAP repeat
MKRLMLLAALPILVHAATAQASFTQELGSPLSVEADPYDVVAADFNKDGRPDLAVANGSASSISVLLRLPGGGFAPEGPAIPAGLGTSALAVADFNSDTRLDLAAANYRSDAVTAQAVFLRNPVAGFSLEAGTYDIRGVQSVVAGDFSGDGQPDVVWGSGFSDAIYVFRRNAGAGFTQEGSEITTGGHKTDLVAADFNGDGKLDIASANNSAPTVSIFLRNAANTGFAVSSEPAVGLDPRKLTVGDFNRDGKADLAVANFGADSVTVLLGRGDGTFAAEPPYAVGDGPLGIATGDFNRDGADDLAVANNGAKTVSVLLRSGDGFVPDPSSPLATGQTGANGVAAADFNGDGRADLAASNQQSRTVTVLLNTTPGPTPPPPPNLDKDGDGVAVPLDCNDANPAIRPGIRDKPGDKIDQDCSGKDAAYRVLNRRIRFAYRTSPAGWTQFTLLNVTPVKKGDRVRLSCKGKGKGCPLGTKRLKVKKSRRTLSLVKRLKDAKLRKGAVLEVRVTRPATIGVTTRWTIRAPKDLVSRSRCLRPGKKKPVRCR